MNPVIEIENVSFRRGTLELLHQINWTIRKGEHWALLGLNGSGKTTLLNIITGYQWPTSGKISVLGHPFGETDLRELRQSIGWVSSSLQEKLYAGDAAQSVVISGKFATIGLYDKPTDEDFSMARHHMESLNCLHLWDREYRTCSQGEKQKLLIARALMSRPALLILDEPCNGLDLFSREKLLQSIQDLARREDSPTLIYVTHHTEEIVPMFSHTLLLRSGAIFESGQTKELLSTDKLSSFFGHPVFVHWNRGRAWTQLEEEGWEA